MDTVSHSLAGWALARAAGPVRPRGSCPGCPPVSTQVGRINRGCDDPWVAAALATRSGQAYLWWRADDEVVVTLRDLRFSRTLVPTAETWTPFTIRFRFDSARRTPSR